MSCKNKIFINGRPINNVQSDLNSYVPDIFREISEDYVQFYNNNTTNKFTPTPCWSYYAESSTVPCDEVTHFLDKNYTYTSIPPLFTTPVHQLDVFKNSYDGIVDINELKHTINTILKTGLNDVVIYQIYFFIQLLHLSNTYYGVNKRLCSITLPWTSTYDCSIKLKTTIDNSKSYKTMDYEIMVALFQRCIVQKDPKLYFTYLFDIVNGLLGNALNSYIKKSRGLDSNFDSLGYKNFYKYMKSEIMGNTVYKFKGNR